MSSQNIWIQSRLSFVSGNLPDKPLAPNCHMKSLSRKTSRWSSKLRAGTGQTDRLIFFGDSKDAGGAGADPSRDGFSR